MARGLKNGSELDSASWEEKVQFLCAKYRFKVKDIKRRLEDLQSSDRAWDGLFDSAQEIRDLKIKLKEHEEVLRDIIDLQKSSYILNRRV